MGHRLGLLWRWMVSLGNKPISFSCFLRFHPSTAYQTLVDYEDYPISFKVFLPTAVNIMVIWIKIHPFLSISVHGFLRYWYKSYHFLLDHVQLTLIHGLNIPGSYAILFCTALELIFISRYIHNGASFPRQPSHLILSGAIVNCPPLFPSSILDILGPRGSWSSVISFCLFILLMRFSRKEYWNGLPSPPPVVHILSEHFSIICPLWVALQGMSHSCIELFKPLCHDKAVSHEGEPFRYDLNQISYDYKVQVLYRSSRQSSWRTMGGGS